MKTIPWIVAIIAVIVALFLYTNKQQPQVVTQIEHHIDSLKVRYAVHDTVEKYLKGKIVDKWHTDTLLVTSHDTIVLYKQVIDTLYMALAECDSAKADRDSVIKQQDTLRVVEKKNEQERDIRNDTIFGGIGILIGLILGIVIMR